jgi:hypothetical protein
MLRILRVVTFLFLLTSLAAGQAAAQYPFGKNKVHYVHKDWRVIETEHAEIFYYPEELVVAEFIAGITEEVYDEFSVYFECEFERKIPIILYGTHHDFKETNVIPYFISEATMGFTEFIKGRVALPFTGSYYELESTFRHEIVHAFQLEKLSQVMKGYRRFTYNQPPLWFMEGLAEFLADPEMSSNAHMVVREAILGGTFFPLDEIWRISGTYMMYKEGESAIHYIATRFGNEAIRVILENWWKGDRFDVVLEKSIGLNTVELSRDWENYLKRKYYPTVLTRRRIDEQAARISPEKGRTVEMHPVCLYDKDGNERVFCLGYGLGSMNLVELYNDGRGEWKRRTRIRGESSTKFESIPLLRSRMSGKGDTLLFVAKRGARDAIYFFDVTRGDILTRIEMAETRILNSPDLSRDGRYLVFSAIDNHGKTDLFVYDFREDSFTRLTDDYYDDIDPDWHPNKELIVFSSDRCGENGDGNYALYSIDPQTRRISPLTDGDHHDVDPRWLEDGSGIIFSSDRDGIYDIFTLVDGRLNRQTKVLGGVFDPYPCPGRSEYLTASYRDGTYVIYKAKIKEEPKQLAIGTVAPDEPAWELAPDTTTAYDDRDYRVRFGIDFIGAMFAVDPGYGTIGNGAQIFFADLLGDHQIALLFGTASDTFDDFWRTINLAATYFNRSSRINYGIGAFHLASYVGGSYSMLRYERRYGVTGALIYPLSKFTRIELQGILKWMERDEDVSFIGLSTGRTLIASSFISITTDNIVWYIGGPLRGHRINIAFGNSLDLQGSRYESTTLNLDFRNYFNLSKRIVFAQRFLSFMSWGSDLQLYYLGGSWDLRGYEFREFTGKRVYLINNELRFPLIDRLLLNLPVGHVDFPIFRGSLFFDIGRADGFIFDTGWLGAYGVGVEMNMGYLPVIRVNFSQLTDFDTVDPKWRTDIFLGFNF